MKSSSPPRRARLRRPIHAARPRTTSSESVIATPSKPRLRSSRYACGLHRRPARAEARVDAVSDHHARHLRLDRRAVRREVGIAHVTTHVGPARPSKRGATRARESAWRMHRPQPAASPRANATPKNGRAELPRAEGPVRQVEHRERGRRPLLRAAVALAVARPDANASLLLVIARADVRRRQPGKRLHRPAFLVRRRRARPAAAAGPRSQRRTITPATPRWRREAGDDDSAAFCCGVSPITATVVMSAATPKASVD